MGRDVELLTQVYCVLWTGDRRPAGCGFAAERRGFLAGCMAWWLGLECGWHCLSAPPDCKESVTMYWQEVGRGCN